VTDKEMSKQHIERLLQCPQCGKIMSMVWRPSTIDPNKNIHICTLCGYKETV
jgi:C4-type Zn-finger protein